MGGLYSTVTYNLPWNYSESDSRVALHGVQYLHIPWLEAFADRVWRLDSIVSEPNARYWWLVVEPNGAQVPFEMTV